MTLYNVTFIVLCGFFFVTALDAGMKPWNLPVFPPVLPDYSSMLENANGKNIPRHLWMAFKDIPLGEERNVYLATFLDRAASHNWTIHLVDNVAKDLFMDTYFNNTSIQWAYNMINPEIGAAKCDIWRYALLYLFGGFYMDDDAYIESPLDEMIHKHDQLVLTWENNKDKNMCFMPHYRLSRNCLNERFNRTTHTMFNGQILVQWAIATAPRHELFRRALETVVDTVRSQFLEQSVVYVGKYDSGSKWIFCSTGSAMLTAVARELFAEQKPLSVPSQPPHVVANHSADPFVTFSDANATYTYTLYANDFEHFGGTFKKVPLVDPKKHYMQRMHHQHIPLLSSYGHHTVEALEGSIVSHNGKELFLVENGQRRGFQDWDAYVDCKFGTHGKKIIKEALFFSIPLNTTVITSREAPEMVARRAGSVTGRVEKNRVCVDPFAPVR